MDVAPVGDFALGVGRNLGSLQLFDGSLGAAHGAHRARENG